MIYSLEAEKGVLGQMITGQAEEGAKLLTADDFFKADHAKLFQTICDMSNNSEIIDMITLSSKGFDFECLMELCNSVVSTQIKHYCTIVKDKSIRRTVIKKAREVIEMAENSDHENSIDFKNDVMQKMDIEVKDSKKQESHIKDILVNVSNVMDNRCTQGADCYKKYGFKWLDEKTGGVKNGLTYLAARPSVGKTALSLSIALNLAKQDLKVCIFNLEIEQEQVAERLLTTNTGINYSKIINPGRMEDKDFISLHQNGIVPLSQKNIKIFDNVFYIEEMRSICRELKNKGELDYVVVDYLQLCDTMKKTINTNDRVSHISRQFKLMQKEFKIPFLVLSQFSRLADTEEPKLSHLRDSGSLEQDADMVLFLHEKSIKYEESNEQPDSKEVRLIIAKQRNGERDIARALKFYGCNQRFYDKELCLLPIY